MSTRTPAGDKGTADRIEADDGGYWVRLVTKQAMRREGECMQNCLRLGSYDFLAGEEDMLPSEMVPTLWSIRKQCGTSYALAQVSCHGFTKVWRLSEMLGPHNTMPPKWAVRQVRHLRDAYRAAGADLRVDDDIALFDLDGMSHRTDVAPVELRELAEKRNGPAWGPRSPRRRIISEEVDRYEFGPATVLFRQSDAPPGTRFEEIVRLGVPWGDIVAQQAAERAFFADRGMDWPGSQSATIGVDTQPQPAPNDVDTVTHHASVKVAEGVAEALRKAVGNVCPIFIHDPHRTDPTSPFGLTSIPGLEVTYVGGDPSGFTRATATPPSPGA